MLNSIGLQNPGIDASWHGRSRASPSSASRSGRRSAAPRPTSTRVSARARRPAEVVAVELNLSCPNVASPEGDVAEIVAAARSARPTGRCTRSSPRPSRTWRPSRAPQRTQARTASRSSTRFAGSRSTGALSRLVWGRRVGGYSGPALKPVALAAVFACCRDASLPIVGHGGHLSGRDALEFLAAGAAPSRSARCFLRSGGASARRGELDEHLRGRGSLAFAAQDRARSSHLAGAGCCQRLKALHISVFDPLDRASQAASIPRHGDYEAPAQAPVRSLDQRMEALARANDIRVRRAQLKKDLKAGRVGIEGILATPPEYVATAKVFDMLMALPKFGRVKAGRFLNQCADQPVEDGRRPLRPPAHGADRPLQAVRR